MAHGMIISRSTKTSSGECIGDIKFTQRTDLGDEFLETDGSVLKQDIVSDDYLNITGPAYKFNITDYNRSNFSDQTASDVVYLDRLKTSKDNIFQKLYWYIIHQIINWY